MSSIYHIKEKIKGHSYIDKRLVFYILIIIIVAIGSFVLGRISVNTVLDNEKVIIVNRTEGEANIARNYPKESPTQAVKLDNNIQGKYVASKNGKLYYRVGCGASSRIKEENKVFFNSTQDAEQAGFEGSSSCTP